MVRLMPNELLPSFENTAVDQATRMIRTCLETQPVLTALTANVMQGDQNDCLQAGMDDYMSNPIDPAEFQRQLEKWNRWQLIWPGESPDSNKCWTNDAPGDRGLFFEEDSRIAEKRNCLPLR